MTIKRNKIFSGTVHQAFAEYINNDELHLAGNFWHNEAVITAVENAENAIKSLQVLQKHLPKRFHSLIRFAQPNITWYLNVEKGITATQLKMLLDDLLIKIARDIGYAPRLRISVQPSHQQWKNSGFPLEIAKKNVIAIPQNDEEAQEIINNFIKRKHS